MFVRCTGLLLLLLLLSLPAVSTQGAVVIHVRWKMLVPARGSVTWHDPHCIVCMLQVFRITQYSCPTSADDAGIVMGKTSIAFTPPVVSLYVTHPVWYIVTIFISCNVVDSMIQATTSGRPS